MNAHPGGRRPRVTTVAAAATFAAVTVLVTACGSSSHGGGVSFGDRGQALAFAKCMRANGVADFPDPDAQSRLRGAGHEQQDNPKFRAAMEACRSLAPGGEHENFGNPVFVEQAREFAQCVRAHGVPDFPDPDAEGRFRGASHEQQDNPKFRAAMQACRQKLPGGGGH